MLQATTIVMFVPMMPKPVIVYDGECRFCQWSVRRIRQLDRREQFEFVPRQSAGLDARFPILAKSDFNTGLRLIEDAGAVPLSDEERARLARLLDEDPDSA